MTEKAKELNRIREMMKRSSESCYKNGLSVVFAALTATLGTIY